MSARTSRHVLLATAGAVSLVLGSPALDAQDVVELRLRGRFYSAPAHVRITVAVEPDAHNRVLRIEADGERMFTASEVKLGGANGQRLHFVEFKNLPAGHYMVRAQVLSTRELRGSAETLLVVGDAADIP